jgi:hypothetical protein
MFPFLASWNKFTGTPMEARLDSHIMEAAYKGYTQNKCSDNMYKSKTQQWISHQLMWILNRHLDHLLVELPSPQPLL